MTHATAAASTRFDWQQAIKVMVYILLLVNFVFYIIDDINAASYTLRNGGTLLQWTQSFATTIDESAWFILLFLFELETHALSDEAYERPWVTRMLHGVRLVCYLSLAHSVYAFGQIYIDLVQVNQIPDVSNLCELVAPDVSFVRNLEYTNLDAINCTTLSNDTRFFFVEPALVVSDQAGYALETRLALFDLLEVVVWLLILLTIEIMVRLQDKGITRGGLPTAIKMAKWGLYAFLWYCAAWWASLEHYHFAWDESLWIIGFLAIEMNMSQWKREIEADAAPGAST